MNPVASTSSVSPFKTVTRSGPAQPVVAQPPEAKVATEVASLSLETRIDLSQKAQVVPPPPPPDNRKSKTKEAKKPETPGSVATTDFTGRNCTGSLNGPLLMEDPNAIAGPEYRSIDFLYDNPRDFEDLKTAGQLLSGLEPEVLLGVAGEKPLADFSLGEARFSYHGVKDGQGLLVQHCAHETAETSQVRLPDGNVAHISRELGQLSIYLPAASLQEMASWGGRLLAEA